MTAVELKVCGRWNMWWMIYLETADIQAGCKMWAIGSSSNGAKQEGLPQIVIVGGGWTRWLELWSLAGCLGCFIAATHGSRSLNPSGPLPEKTHCITSLGLCEACLLQGQKGTKQGMTAMRFIPYWVVYILLLFRMPSPSSLSLTPSSQPTTFSLLRALFLWYSLLFLHFL